MKRPSTVIWRITKNHLCTKNGYVLFLRRRGRLGLFRQNFLFKGLGVFFKLEVKHNFYSYHLYSFKILSKYFEIIISF